MHLSVGSQLAQVFALHYHRHSIMNENPPRNGSRGMHAGTITKDLDKYQLHDIWLMHHKGRAHKRQEAKAHERPCQRPQVRDVRHTQEILLSSMIRTEVEFPIYL